MLRVAPDLSELVVCAEQENILGATRATMDRAIRRR
jgi:hypothetical protein